jgi:hypothetical protein
MNNRQPHPWKRLLSRNLKKLAETSEEDHGPRRAVEPMMVVVVVNEH